MILHLRAKPNARANQLLVASNGSATVHLKAPPQEGQVNTAILAYLAGVFSTSKSRVEPHVTLQKSGFLGCGQSLTSCGARSAPGRVAAGF